MLWHFKENLYADHSFNLLEKKKQTAVCWFVQRTTYFQVCQWDEPKPQSLGFFTLLLCYLGAYFHQGFQPLTGVSLLKKQRNFVLVANNSRELGLNETKGQELSLFVNKMTKKNLKQLKDKHLHTTFANGSKSLKKIARSLFGNKWNLETPCLTTFQNMEKRVEYLMRSGVLLTFKT